MEERVNGKTTATTTTKAKGTSMILSTIKINVKEKGARKVKGHKTCNS